MANFTRRFALISDGVVEASTIKTRVKNPVSTPVVGGTGSNSSDPAPYATSTDSQGAIKAQPAESPQRPNTLTLGYKETFVDFQSAPVNTIKEFVAYRDHVLPPGGVLTVSLGGNVDPLSGGNDVEIARGRNRGNDASGTIRIIASGQSTSGARMTFRANPKFNYDPEGYLPEGVDQLEMSSRSLGAYQFKQRPTVFSKTVCLRQIQQAKAYHSQRVQSPALPPEPMPESNYNFALNDQSPLEPAPINGHVNNPRLINLSNGYLLSMWLEGVEIQPNFLINFTDKANETSSPLYWTNSFSNSHTDGNICFSICSPKTRQWSRPVRLANVNRSYNQGGPTNWGFTMASSDPDAAAARSGPYIQSFDVAEDPDSKVVFLSVLYSRGTLNPSEIEMWSSPVSDLIFDIDSDILRPEISSGVDPTYSYSRTLPFKRKSSFMIGKDAALSTEGGAPEGAESYTVNYPDPIPGLDIASQGSCVSIACEFLTSGRLMLALSTQERLYSLVSDDLGLSFAPTEVLNLLFQDEPFTSQMEESRWVQTVRQFHTHLTIRNLDGGETALLLCASAFNSRMPLAQGGIRVSLLPEGAATPAYLQDNPSDGKEGMSIISLWVTSDGVSFSPEIPLGRNERHWAQGCETGLWCDPVQKTSNETSWYIPSPVPDPDPGDNLAGDRGYGMRIINQVSAWEADIVQRDDGYIQVYIATANVGGPHFQFTENMFGPPPDNPEENPFPKVGDVRFTYSWGYGGWGYKQTAARWDNTLNPPQLRVYDRDEQTNSLDTTACNQLFTRTLRLQSLTAGTTEAPLLTNMTPLMGLQTGGDKLRPGSPQNTIRSKRGAWATNWMPCNTIGQTEQNTTPLGGGVDFDSSTYTDLPGFFTVGARPFGYRDGYYTEVPQPNVASGGENPPVGASQFVAYPTFANGVMGVSAVRFRGEVVVASAINQITFRHATLPIFQSAPTPWNLPSGASQSDIAAIREGSLRIQSTSYWQPISENIGTMSCNSICGPNDMFQDMNGGFITTIDPNPAPNPPYSLAPAVLSNFRYANQSLRFTRATVNSLQTNHISVDSHYIYAPNLGPGDPFLVEAPANRDVPPIVGQFIASQLKFLLSGQYLGKFYHDCWDCWGRPDQQGWIDTFSWENPSRGLVPWTSDEWLALFGDTGAGLVMYDAFTEPSVGLYGGPSIQRDTNKYYPAGMLQGSHGGFMEITGARNFVKSGSLCYDKHEEATQTPRGFGLSTNVPEPEYNFALPNYMGAQSSMTSWQGGLSWDASSHKWVSSNRPMGSGLECSIRMVVAVVEGGAKNIGGTEPQFSELNPCSTTDGINCDVQLIGIGGMTDLVDPQGYSSALAGPVGWDHSGPVPRENGSRVRFQVSICRKPKAATTGDHPSEDIYVQVADLGPGGPANPLIIGSIRLKDDPLANGVRDEMRFDVRQAGRPSPDGSPWLTANKVPRKYLNYPRFVEILVSTIEYNPRELQTSSPSESEFRTYIKCVARVLDQVEDPDGLAPFLPVTWQNLQPGYPGSFPPDMPIGIPGSDYLQLFSTPTNLNNESSLEFVKWGHDTGASGSDPTDDWSTVNVSRWKSFHFSRPDTFRVPKDSLEYTRYANAQPGSQNDQFGNLTRIYQRFNNKGLQTYPWRLMNTTQVQSQSDDYILRDIYGSEMAGYGINVSEIPIPGNDQIDTGLLTPLEPVQINPLRPNHLESGMVIDLKGSYLQSGNYGYSIKGESPAENVKDSPIVNSWVSRSGNEEYVMGASRTILKNSNIDYPDIGQTWARSKAALCPDIEVFFDAGEDPGAIFNEATKNQVLPGDAGVFGRAGAFRGFRPEAFALLGHNSPGYKIEFFQENPYPTEPTAGATPGNIAGGGKPVLQMYFILGGDPILGGQYNVHPTYLNPTTGDKRALDPKIIRRYMHSYWIPYDKFTDPESGQQRWQPNPKGMGVSIGANAITLRPAWWGDRPENQPGPGGVPELEGGAENWANDPTSKPQQRASLIPWRPTSV